MYLHVAGMNDISQIIGAAPSVPVINIDYLHPGFIIATLSPSAPYIFKGAMSKFRISDNVYMMCDVFVCSYLPFSKCWSLLFHF